MRGWILIGLFGMMTGCGGNGGSVLEQVASGVASEVASVMARTSSVFSVWT